MYFKVYGLNRKSNKGIITLIISSKLSYNYFINDIWIFQVFFENIK